jgi:hypothetical protein
MNIFYLDSDPVQAAKMICDKHVVKMPLESAQMLCTAHRVLDDVDVLAGQPLYKSTHKNHPSSKWVRKSQLNYMWLYEHFIALCDEYKERYGREHLTFTKLSKPLWYVPENISVDAFTEPPTCMPDHCIREDAISSYRMYYKTEKSSIAKWDKLENMPDWYTV